MPTRSRAASAPASAASTAKEMPVVPIAPLEGIVVVMVPGNSASEGSSTSGGTRVMQRIKEVSVKELVMGSAVQVALDTRRRRRQVRVHLKLANINQLHGNSKYWFLSRVVSLRLVSQHAVAFGAAQLPVVWQQNLDVREDIASLEVAMDVWDTTGNRAGTFSQKWALMVEAHGWFFTPRRVGVLGSMGCFQSVHTLDVVKPA